MPKSFGVSSEDEGDRDGGQHDAWGGWFSFTDGTRAGAEGEERMGEVMLRLRARGS